MTSRLLALGASVLAFAPNAFAAAPTDRSFPGERFQPAIDDDSLGVVETAHVPDHMSWDAALFLGYANNSLFLIDPNSGRRGVPLVESRLHGNLVGAISLFDWIEVGADLPVLLLQQRDEGRAPGFDQSAPAGTASSLHTTGLGDLRVVPKIRLLREKSNPLDLAILATFTAPTSQLTGTDYFGEKGFTFAPALAASKHFGAVTFAVNMGLRLRAPVLVSSLEINNELTYGAAVGYHFDVVPEHPTTVSLSLAGSTILDGLSVPTGVVTRAPLELLGEMNHALAGPVHLVLGGGVGIVPGYGTPDFRIFAAVRLSEHQARVIDTDGDGIPDELDKCPRQAEDKDGFEDSDGCPDPDNDGDGILDVDDACPNVKGTAAMHGCPDSDGDGIADNVDKCPNAAEDKDGFEDDDGCPDLDNDGDGINDADDACPNDKGTAATHGCPDSDGDGIADKDDKCPNAAEDKDGYEDSDGCPDLDNDGDGINDVDDHCPNDKGPAQNGGCPDTDKDGDGVVDRLDNCPDEPGTVENHGCKAKQLVAIAEGKLEISERVYFKTNSDQLDKRSDKLLDNVAAVLQAHPELKKIVVEGHTDNKGKPEANKDLSQRRAKSVVKYLVGKGVDDARLAAEGYGEERPVADNDTSAGREKNRRVEFKVP
jgi:outer membrane protein OmpA-like peptidoglycan-associated protein